MLLGNHDLELSFPAVRRALCHELRAIEGVGIRFIVDGEAYTVGNALVEHGNRYDPYNVADADGLRRHRSLLSRGQNAAASSFEPPIGSRLVASVFNHYKRKHAFIDLLHPLRQATLPLLLTLEPGAIKSLLKLYPLLDKWRRKVDSLCVPGQARAIAESRHEPTGAGKPEIEDVIRELTGPILGTDSTAELASLVLEEDAKSERPQARDIAFSSVRKLTAAFDNKRLRLLAGALRGLEQDQSHDVHFEPKGSQYLKCAGCLGGLGWKYVIFGHTHFAKDISLGFGARYLNTGTWTDTMRIPTEYQDGSVEKVSLLLDQLERRDYSNLDAFNPTYVLIRTKKDRSVLSVELRDYQKDGSSL